MTIDIRSAGTTAELQALLASSDPNQQPEPSVAGSSLLEPRDESLFIGREPTTQLMTGAVLAQIMIELGFERRKSNRKAREAAEGAIRVANQTELAEMKTAADLKHQAAQEKAWGQVAVGAVGLASVGMSAFRGRDTMLSMYRNGGEKFVEGSFSLWSAHTQHEADDADVRAKSAEQAGEGAERLNSDVIEDDKAIRESIRKAIDLYKEYVNGVTASQQAAVHRT